MQMSKLRHINKLPDLFSCKMCELYAIKTCDLIYRSTFVSVLYFFSEVFE